MTKRLIIFGAGDIARLAHFYFSRDTDHEIVAFAVDADFRKDDRFCALPLVDFEEIVDRYPPDDFEMFVALSYAKMNLVRADRFALATRLGYSLTSYVSPRCTWLTEHPPGRNCFVLEDNTVQPMARIGDDVTLWSGNHIGHDSSIGDHTFVSSHVVVSGFVRVGTHCFLGVNATLRNSITLGDRTLVGAGSIIMGDTAPDSVYVPERTRAISRMSHEIDL